ncbi:MAG: hypothetical protein DRI24_24710 [Deltaproteobacteria bacterium]|nr:MAG: hypothetical protein DRI24_24710 [Deltaproteobacteria bacterium]
MSNRNLGRRNPGNRHGVSKKLRSNQTKGKRVDFNGGKKRTSQIPVRKPSIPISLRSVPVTDGEVVKYLYILVNLAAIEFTLPIQ